LLLIGVLVLLAVLLSTNWVRGALPFESLVVLGAVAVVTLTLFQAGKLG
jgi:hypothetical protein